MAGLTANWVCASRNRRVGIGKKKLGPRGISPGPAGNSEAPRKAEPFSAVRVRLWSGFAFAIAPELDSAFFPALSFCLGKLSLPDANLQGNACAFRLLSAARPFCLRGLPEVPFLFGPVPSPRRSRKPLIAGPSCPLPQVTWERRYLAQAHLVEAPALPSAVRLGRPARLRWREHPSPVAGTMRGRHWSILYAASARASGLSAVPERVAVPLVLGQLPPPRASQRERTPFGELFAVSSIVRSLLRNLAEGDGCVRCYIPRRPVDPAAVVVDAVAAAAADVEVDCSQGGQQVSSLVFCRSN